MASATQIIVVDPVPGAIELAERRLRQLEATWSRFLVSSDISQLNQASGEWIRVSVDTIRLIEAMQVAATMTAGAFDPTCLHQLLSVGYTASIDDPDRITVSVETPQPGHGVHDIEVDRAGLRVRLPQGLSLDAGGIGKGFAADLVVTELIEAGCGGALVSVGGDLGASGTAPSPDGWRVNVDDPFHPGTELLAFMVSAGGVATSSTRSRRWTHQGAEVHHVIDPITGNTSATDLATATVVASSGWRAEAHATAALLRGQSGGLNYLDEHGLVGILVTADGTVVASDSLEVPPLLLDCEVMS